jgi:hypothetical protein
MAAVIVRESRHLRLVDLAALLDRDLSGLSQGARRLEGKLRGDKELRKRLEEIRNILNTHLSSLIPIHDPNPIILG